MTSLLNEKQNRRNWLRALGRSAALFGLAIGGWMTTRGWRSDSQKNECQYAHLCRECSILNRCELPQALSAKGMKKERRHG